MFDVVPDVHGLVFISDNVCDFKVFMRSRRLSQIKFENSTTTTTI